MTRRRALAFALAVATPAAISRPASGVGRPALRLASPGPALAALPSIPRVWLELAGNHVIATEEVDLPRGEWKGGDLDVYVAFGAPGTPEAFDAHLLGVPDGALEPSELEVGEKLNAAAVPRRPANVHELIGPQDMAGSVVHVPEGSFRRALAPGGMAALRFRTLLQMPEGDSVTGYEVLVRLGQERSTPLTLGRVQVAAADNAPPIRRAEARLCGRDADPWPLAVTVLSKRSSADLSPSHPRAFGAIAPVLAVRHASDDLCVRFWL